MIVENPAFMRAVDADAVRSAADVAGRRVFVAENYVYKPLAAHLRRLDQLRVECRPRRGGGARVPGGPGRRAGPQLARRAALLPALRDPLGYRAMLADFLRALRTGEQSLLSLDMVQRDLSLLEQAERAMSARASALSRD